MIYSFELYNIILFDINDMDHLLIQNYIFITKIKNDKF
jgi:hypothetical protein